MTRQQIFDSAESHFGTIWSEIQGFQETYFLNHNRYFQGLFTHTQIPSDGQEAAPNLLADKPEGQEESWLDTGINFGPMSYSLSVDIYSGPNGSGYVVNLKILILDEIWIKNINSGNETWHEQNWHLLIQSVF